MTQNITKEKEKEKTRVMMLFLCHFSLFGLERRTQKKNKKKAKKKGGRSSSASEILDLFFFFFFLFEIATIPLSQEKRGQDNSVLPIGFPTKKRKGKGAQRTAAETIAESMYIIYIYNIYNIIYI